ncbi:MAG: BolA family transcriptional regulator [Azonexus sp.]|jgi:BolA protein|nr:BolA family transcriptional regulator [Azonexus sp.]
MTTSTIEALRQRLASLQPARLNLTDESRRHVGHAGAGAGGHFQVDIVAAVFYGKNALARHRLVYDAAGDLLRHRIHALIINAHSPDEV